jgi:hypothetical protein
VPVTTRRNAPPAAAPPAAVSRRSRRNRAIATASDIARIANGASVNPSRSERYAPTMAHALPATADAAPASTPISGIGRMSLSFSPGALMFIGHFGLAFGAKKAAPAASLGTLFAACQFADLLWPTLVLLGYERVEVRPGVTRMTPLDFISYPYSHSLLALCAWAVAFGAIYYAIRRARISAAVIVALLVVSHWLLDYATHRPDLPLTPGGAHRYGLGLWNSIPGTVAIEVTIFLAGLLLYLRATTARDRAGSAGVWALAIFMLAIYLASAFGPPPPSAAAVAWSAEAMWLLVVWGYWVDSHRIPHRN